MSWGVTRFVWPDCSATVQIASRLPNESLSDVSTTYVIDPTGPERGALVKVNVGCSVSTLTLLIGATGVGAWITIGTKMSKLARSENGPVFAPSSARPCQ